MFPVPDIATTSASMPKEAKAMAFSNKNVHHAHAWRLLTSTRSTTPTTLGKTYDALTGSVCCSPMAPDMIFATTANVNHSMGCADQTLNARGRETVDDWIGCTIESWHRPNRHCFTLNVRYDTGGRPAITIIDLGLNSLAR